MFADLQPEPAMIEAVRAARTRRLKTGLITNSWGMGIYDRAPTDLFDVAVISGEVGLHKPQPEIYLLACERLEVEPAEAVFVDDLRENCAGAEAVGMTALLHRDPGRDDGEARAAARARAQQRIPAEADADPDRPRLGDLDHRAAVLVATQASPSVTRQ